MRFNQLIADALVRDGVDAEADARGPRGEVDVAFTYDGTWYLLEAKWEADPIDSDPVHKLHGVLSERRPGSMGILVSWSGFKKSALRRAEHVRNIILFDRTHIEALVAGVVTAAELIGAANRAISVYGHEHNSLSTLLRPRRTTENLVNIGVPEGFTPSAVGAPDAINADVLAYGSAIRGLAEHRGRLLITDDGGLLELDTQKSRLQRRFELTGCTGNAFADEAGGVLVSRGGGVIRVNADSVEVVAGGYTRAPLIVPGVEDRAWILDLSTSGWSGSQPGHLVDPGDHVGDERRYSTALPAGNCVNACWMREKVFFVLGAGHSCVVDLHTGEGTWIPTPVARPYGVIRLSTSRVLIVGWERHLQTAVIDVDSQQASELTSINLAFHAGDAVKIDDSVVVIGGAPVSSAEVVPVVARLDLNRLLFGQSR
jgi:hypothetical protein